ncbi:unnamed protein product [Cochlearia groenlandica]
MYIPKKMLIVFVLSILFISYVNCTHSNPGFGIKQEYKKCYNPCGEEGRMGCERFCGAISFQLRGVCLSGICCCISKN